MFIKISHNSLKNRQNVANMLCGAPKSRRFSAFLSHYSKIIFEKRLFRQFQRPALPAAGEDQLAKRETAIAQDQLQKRAESQPSGARFVGPVSFWEKPNR